MATTNHAGSWTLHFHSWECGHHQDCPGDIGSIESPEQAKAILSAIAAAISQPGSARAVLVNDIEGFRDIYLTDDYCDFNPNGTPVPRPYVVLCDEGTMREILSEEMKGAREEVMEPDLCDAKEWDDEDWIGPWDAVLTTLTREQFDRRMHEDRELVDLPPRYLHGPAVLAQLRQAKADLDEYLAEREREEREAYERDQAADLKRDEQSLEGGAA